MGDDDYECAKGNELSTTEVSQRTEKTKLQSREYV